MIYLSFRKNYMNKTDIKFLQMSLEELKQFQSNAGCNDFSMPANPENIEFMKKLNEHFAQDIFEIDGKHIVGLDMFITQYFLDKLTEMPISNS